MGRYSPQKRKNCGLRDAVLEVIGNSMGGLPPQNIFKNVASIWAAEPDTIKGMVSRLVTEGLLKREECSCTGCGRQTTVYKKKNAPNI